MPPRRAPVALNVPIISSKDFCWICVCFLGTVLVLQICVLVSLLGRLAEVRHAGDLQTSVKVSDALDSAELSTSEPNREPFPETAGGVTMDFMAVASAVGSDQDAMTLFVQSYQRATQSQLVLLVEPMVQESDLQNKGLDMTRVKLERVLPLPGLWSTLSREDTHLFFIHQYLQQMPGHVKILQLSDVDDIVFQADPFAWASEQEPGLHLFLDEPGVVVNSGKMWKILEFCYGTQAVYLHAKPRVPAGYMIGSSADVQQFVADLMDEVASKTACHKPGVVNAFANHMAHAAHPGVSLHLHDNRRGPVWSGFHVAANSFESDAENHVINEDGYQYAVLRGYHAHDTLWSNIGRSFEKLSPSQDAEVPDTCAAFFVEACDMPGHDLTHSPKETEAGCCAACTANVACGAFTFSPSRKHCWLKKPFSRKTTNPASDMRCGVRAGDALRGLPPTGVV
ncbi:aarA [Symbiodinium natans]|uniref:AarA protein n=1 Tax=Symbiodinium natans TaxID=878477 RepID=A0A812R559_9DINO|nr:aarA [Symbiodinium natans]